MRIFHEEHEGFEVVELAEEKLACEQLASRGTPSFQSS
jgi:hypothetical protein